MDGGEQSTITSLDYVTMHCAVGWMPEAVDDDERERLSDLARFYLRWATNAAGVYKGRPEDIARNAGIAAMLKAGSSWSQIQAATGCSRATVFKISKRLDQAA